MDEQEKPTPDHFIVEKKYDTLVSYEELQRWCAWLICLPEMRHWETIVNSKADEDLSYHIVRN